MRRPSLQFYPGDWTGNTNLRRCTHCEKGAWIDTMCLMHDSEEYGILRWPLKDIAHAIGCNITDLEALIEKGVMKGDDEHFSPSFSFRPYSGRQYGPAVTLIPAQKGPLWFSSRMVRDEYVRKQRGKGTRFGDDGHNQQASPNHSPIRRVGEAFGVQSGDGPSSSSSSSVPTPPGHGGDALYSKCVHSGSTAQYLSNGGENDF